MSFPYPAAAVLIRISANTSDSVSLPASPGSLIEVPTVEEAHMDDGSTDTAKGKVKKAAGDLTGDDDLKREGHVDEASGTVKDKVGDAADKVKDALRRDDD